MVPSHALRAFADREWKCLQRMDDSTLPVCELIAKITGHQEALCLMEPYGSLTALARAGERELMDVPGVGISKAASLKSALGHAD
jgi:ERCC4-type nuclease